MRASARSLGGGDTSKEVSAPTNAHCSARPRSVWGDPFVGLDSNFSDLSREILSRLKRGLPKLQAPPRSVGFRRRSSSHSYSPPPTGPKGGLLNPENCPNRQVIRAPPGLPNNIAEAGPWRSVEERWKWWVGTYPCTDGIHDPSGTGMCRPWPDPLAPSTTPNGRFEGSPDWQSHGVYGIEKMGHGWRCGRIWKNLEESGFWFKCFRALLLLKWMFVWILFGVFVAGSKVCQGSTNYCRSSKIVAYCSSNHMIHAAHGHATARCRCMSRARPPQASLSIGQAMCSALLVVFDRVCWIDQLH